MKRNEYLELRGQMQSGLVDDKVMKLFFEYWCIFRDDMRHLDPDYDTFAQTFTQYLCFGNNYINALECCLDYFDKIYSTTTVSYAKEPNKILATV